MVNNVTLKTRLFPSYRWQRVVSDSKNDDSFHELPIKRKTNQDTDLKISE